MSLEELFGLDIHPFDWNGIRLVAPVAYVWASTLRDIWFIFLVGIGCLLRWWHVASVSCSFLQPVWKKPYDSTQSAEYSYARVALDSRKLSRCV